MGKSARLGKSSEFAVIGELMMRDLDIYIPTVDDKAIDFIIRFEFSDSVIYYEVQVKSVKGYNCLIGIDDLSKYKGNKILIVHYRHDSKKDEFFYFTPSQMQEFMVPNAKLKDFKFNKDDRERYSIQNLDNLALKVKKGDSLELV